MGEAIKVARKQSAEDSLRRRKRIVEPPDEIPAWTRRGLFKPGFTLGPRLKGGKLYTKAREVTLK